MSVLGGMCGSLGLLFSQSVCMRVIGIKVCCIVACKGVLGGYVLPS